MDMYPKYKSPFGYETGDNGIDSYGVDHRGFSLRDEIEYQTARDQRESQLMQMYNGQGITENYPQYTTNFWGDSGNNYGFGSSNISSSISTHPAMNTTPVPITGQTLTPQTNTLSSWNGGNISANSSFGTTSESQTQTPTPWSTSATPMYTTSTPWRNNQTLTPWNGGYDLSSYGQSNRNHISDEDLYARMWENIKQFERVVPYPYLDTKGFVTIGGGANVDNWNVFKNLNGVVDGIPATEAQKWKAYNIMRQLSDEKDANGNYVNRNLKAKAFENKTNIRISDTEARGLAQNHMTNDLTHLRGEFSDFDSFPLPLKEVLLDIQYNTGNLNQQNWPNLYNAIHGRDINGIVDNVNRKDVQQDRNDWAKRMARSIRF